MFQACLGFVRFVSGATSIIMVSSNDVYPLVQGLFTSVSLRGLLQPVHDMRYILLHQNLSDKDVLCRSYPFTITTSNGCSLNGIAIRHCRDSCYNEVTCCVRKKHCLVQILAKELLWTPANASSKAPLSSASLKLELLIWIITSYSLYSPNSPLAA